MTTKKVLVVCGTRPEAIKLAPVVHELRSRRAVFSPRLVTTGQHREMLDPMLADFDLRPDADLGIMRPDQSPGTVTAVALSELSDVVQRERPDCVVVQGDTSTTFAGALAAAYQRVPVAHVEAGLRTFDRGQPFPEELHRCLTAQLADLHFCPTERAKDNLLREGIDARRIEVTGNTSIDALQLALRKAGDDPADPANGREILITAHRRENHGPPLIGICEAAFEILERHADIRVTFPVHLNPRVQATVRELLGAHPRARVCDPLDYSAFVRAMRRSHLVLTDSGGVQEEAPSLGKPVLVLRERTERVEAVEAGTALLVGTDPAKIVAAASRLLSDADSYRAMARIHNPFGDGRAAERIADALASRL